MRRAVPVLILLLAACRERPQSEWARATFHPAHRIDLSGPGTLAEWVDARSASEVQSVWISPVKAPLRLDPLSKLQGLRALTLSGFADQTPTAKGGEFLFPPALTDTQVADLARIKTLRAIALWYGSFSKEQRETLRTALPDCDLLENLNKL